jgi:hypothetical protein
MSIFDTEQRDQNIASLLQTLAGGKLAATGPAADEILAVGLLVILRKLDELSDAVDKLKARAG